MDMQKQVNSQELGRKLLDLGVTKPSYFVWDKDAEEGIAPWWQVEVRTWIHDGKKEGNVLPAYTVAELGEMLPRLTSYRIWQQHSKDDSKLAGKWSITINEVKDDNFTDFMAETEADARAKMLIYLIENGLVKPEEL